MRADVHQGCEATVVLCRVKARHLPFGGTRALRGCDPKKVLVGAAEAIDHVRRMRGHGLAGGEPAIAWDELMRFKRSFTEPVPTIKEESFAKKGIDACHGTVIEQSDRMLAPFDPDLVGSLMEKFHQTGVDVRLRTRVTAIEKSSDGPTVRAAANGKEALFEADLAVHAAGRVPDLEPLDLAAAGVTTGRGRLELNEFLQSVSNPAVYAVGDAASSGPALTPVASHDAEVAASNMLDGNHDVPNYLGVPSAAFTTPPIASVGMSEQQVCDSGMKFRMKSEKASSWYTARRVAETTYGFKVSVDESIDRILGAHLISPHCEEVINIFGLAIRKGLTAEDLKTTMFAYPTATSDIGYML